MQFRTALLLLCAPMNQPPDTSDVSVQQITHPVTQMELVPEEEFLQSSRADWQLAIFVRRYSRLSSTEQVYLFKDTRKK